MPHPFLHSVPKCPDSKLITFSGTQGELVNRDVIDVNRNGFRDRYWTNDETASVRR